MLNTLRIKIAGTGVDSPKRASLVKMAAGFVGGTLGITLLALLTDFYHVTLLMAPFGASCVLLFAAPDAPLAQPRNVIGGHVIATTIGLVAVQLAPGVTPLVMGASVGLAIVAMQFTRTLHPPAGADPLVVLALGKTASWTFLITPALAGAVILVLIALVINNLEAGSKWPKYWL